MNWNVPSRLLTLVLLTASACRGSVPAGAKPPPTPTKPEPIAQALMSSGPAQALLVVNVASPLSSGDTQLQSRLSALGFSPVSVVTGTAVSATDCTGKAVVVISESVTDSATVIQVGTKLKTVAVPVVVLEPNLFDDMGMTTTANLGVDTTTRTQVTIATGGHPMTAGLASGAQTVVSPAQTFGYGVPASTAEIAATTIGSTTRAAIFGYKSGVTMASGTAAARRVGWFASNATIPTLNANGWKLFDAAVNWAARPTVLVTASTTLTVSETVLKTHLESLNLSVQPMTAASITATTTGLPQLIVIPDSGTAGTLTNKLVSVAVPILCLQAASFTAANLKMAGTTGTLATQTKLDIVKAGHPLAGGLTGSGATGVVVTPSTQTFEWGGTLGTGAVKVATINNDATKATIFAYPRGAALTDGTTAAARRVGWWASAGALTSLAAPPTNAWTLFDAAVKWAQDGVLDATCESKADGFACNDGNACTQSDTCVNQECVGSNPKVCTASDQCHTAGTCNPADGTCSNPAKANGVTCNDSNACTQTDTCQAGTCTGGNPVVCTASDQCHGVGVCNSGTGVCSNPALANGTSCNDGNSCTQTDTCQSGTCTGANPVVCVASDQCHAVGVCNSTTGLCSNPAKTNGTTCSDGNSCTQTDTCQSGTCTGANPVVCTALDQCHTAGTCNTGTGVCSNPAKSNGAVCTDGNACTTSDSCQNGACVGASPVVCTASDQCHGVGTCNTSTGSCSNPSLVDGTGCNDGNACTRTDACQAGSCVGANPVTCTAQDSCHVVGTCNQGTGTCSNPAKPDNTACDDGNRCTQTDTCQSGTCTGASPVVCGGADQCHSAGVCDPLTGTCSGPSPLANGTMCNDQIACTTMDTCTGGQCTGNAATCTTGLEIDAGDYDGGLCLDSDCRYIDYTFSVTPGIHTLTAPWSVGSQGALLAHVNVAIDGTLTDPDSPTDQSASLLYRHFTVAPRSLTAKTADLVVNFTDDQGRYYNGWISVDGVGYLVSDANTLTLLRDRSYEVEAGFTTSDSMPTSSQLSSAPYGLTVNIDGTAVTVDAEMGRTLQATGTMTLIARTVPVQFAFNGYNGIMVPSGTLAYLWSQTSQLLMLRGRNYGMEAWYTEGGTDFDGPTMSRTYYSFKIPVDGADIGLDSDLLRSLDPAPPSGTVANVSVRAANVTINPGGNPNPLCIGNVGCSIGDYAAWNVRLMAGRKYRIGGGGTFVVDGDGSCATTSVPVGTYSATVSCSGVSSPGTTPVLVVRATAAGQTPLSGVTVTAYDGTNVAGTAVTNANGVADLMIPATPASGSYRFGTQWWNTQFWNGTTNDCCSKLTIVVSGVEVTVMQQPENTPVTTPTLVKAFSGPPSWSTLVASAQTGTDGIAQIGLPPGVIYRFQTTVGGRDFWSDADCAVSGCGIAVIQTGGECFRVANDTPCEGGGDICVGLKRCQNDQCVQGPAAVVEQLPCMINSCDPAAGVTHVPDLAPETEGARCDAGGSLCGSKTCQAGACTASAPAICGVEPLFTCLSQNGPVSTAVMGYRNPSSADISELAGSELNSLAGNVGGQVQPSWFQRASSAGTAAETSGTRPAIFTVDFSTAFTWKVGDTTLSVNSGSGTACNLESPLCDPGNVLVGSECFPMPLTPEIALRDSQVATDVSSDGKTPGGIDGSFAVTNDGAATYAMPLWVPPGRASMQPDLTLRFSSRAGNGLFGIGWSIVGTGFSQITRCKRTIAQDGFVAPVHFDSRDAFCLDSQRLVAIAGTYGAEGTEYRTERDSFTKIVSKDVDAQGPRTFEVRLKDGRILTYGNALNALLQGKRIQYVHNATGEVARFPGEDARYSWAVSRVEDRPDGTGAKNRMVITYQQVQEPLDDDYAHTFVPSRIDYTADGNGAGALKSVYFSTDVTPAGDAVRPDVIEEYVAGFKLRVRGRINRIEIKAAPKPGALQDVVRSYDITYDADPISKLSRIHSVEQCDAAGICMRPTIFQWQDTQVSFEEVSLPQISDPLKTSESQGENAYKSRLIQPLDVNGDGLDDILYRAEGTVSFLQNEPSWFVRLSTGESFGSATELGIDANIFWGNRFARNPRVIDLELDGKADLALSWYPDPTFGQQRWHWYTSTGSGVPPYGLLFGYGSQADENAGIIPLELQPADVNDLPMIVGDFNGDSFPDVLRQFYVSTASRWAIRLNADGQLQPYRVVATTDQFPIPTPLPTPTYPGQYSPYPPHVVDLDGAGRTALLFRAWDVPASDPNFWVSLASFYRVDIGGDQADPQTVQPGLLYSSIRSSNLNVYGGSQTSPDLQTLFGDFNGDGLIDALNYEEGGSAYLALNFGGDFGISQRLTIPAGYQMLTPMQVVDVNQDGRQDLVLLGAGNGRAGAKILLSTGDSFVPLDPAPLLPAIPENTYMLQQMLDVNGDGLLDLIQSEADGKLHLYVRRGKGNQLIGITNGMGVQTNVKYRAIAESNSDSNCRAPRICPSRGVWVVSDAWIDDGSPVASQHHLVHTFGQMAMDTHGRGFLGFGFHTIKEEATKTTRTIILDNSTTDGTAYPLADQPKYDTTIVELESGRAIYNSRKFEYNLHRTNGGTTYFASPKRLTEMSQDLGADSTTTTTVAITEYDYDQFGNVTREELVTVPRAIQDDEVFAEIVGERLKKIRTFDSDTVNWLVGKQTSETWSSAPASGGSPTERTLSFVPDPTTGLPQSATIEPSGDATMYLKREFIRERGRLTSVKSTDKAGNVREERMTYDNYDGSTLASVTNAMGHTTKIFFSPTRGVLAAQEDPNGARTFWQYDGFGRQRHQSRGDGGDTSLNYGDGFFSGTTGMSVAVQTTGGPDQTTYYDRLGRPVYRNTSNFEGGLSSGVISYDKLHGKVAIHETLSDTKTPKLTTNFLYDRAGRLTHQSTPDGNGIDYVYVGRQTTISDTANRNRIVREDELGRVVESVDVAPDATESITTSTYDAFGTLKTVTDAKGNTTTVTYDRLGRRLSVQDPDSGLTTFTPDAFGGIADTTDANNVKTTYTLDKLGRVRFKKVGTGTAETDWDSATYGIGRVATTTSFDGVVKEMTYDRFGRPITQGWKIDGEPSREIKFGYDNVGRLNRIDYPTTAGWPRFAVNYEYTTSGQMKKVTDVNKVTDTNSAFVYWEAQSETAFGQILSESFGGGIVSGTRTYDKGHLKGLTVTGPDGPLQSLTHEYWSTGNLKKRTDGINQVTENFIYDHLDRLSQWYSDSPGWTVDYSYDEIGNLKKRKYTPVSGSVEDLTTTYSGVNAGPHAVTNSAWGEYKYDSKGNQKETPDGLIAYTDFNLPRTITGKSGGASAAFEYDGDDVRVVKRISGSNATKTVYVGGLYEQRDDGSHIFYVVIGGRTIAQVERTTVGGIAKETPFFLHSDHLGNVETVSDSDGHLVSHRKIDPFGNGVDLANPALRLPGRTEGQIGHVSLGFTEHEQDFELGLVNMTGRLYNPKIGRFMTPDPFVSGESTGSLNRYSYVENNPMNMVDPSGFSSESDGPDYSSGSWTLTYSNFQPITNTINETYQWDPNPSEGLGFGAGSFSSYGDPKGGSFGPSEVVSRIGGGAVGSSVQAQGGNPAGAVINPATGQPVLLASRDWLTGEEGKFTIFIPFPDPAGVRGLLSSLAQFFGRNPTTMGPAAEAARRVANQLETAAGSGGPFTQLFTRLTQAPVVGRALSTAAGEGAIELTGRAQPTGQLFGGAVPTRLIMELEKLGWVQKATTLMGDVQAIEYRFNAEASKYVANFFGPIM